jgi:proteasome assembly chaperone (PAC2) family protein
MALDELGATAFYTHDYKSGYAACEMLLKENRLPPSEVERVQKNHKAYTQKLAEMQQMQAQMQAQQQAQQQKQPPKSAYIPPRANRFKERKK